MKRFFHLCNFLFTVIIPKAQTVSDADNAKVNLSGELKGVYENSRWKFVCQTGMGCNG